MMRKLARSFVFTDAPCPTAHASTLCETDAGLACAWFGGRHEGAADVGIWLAQRDVGGWQPPRQIAVASDARDRPVPTWNPVLHRWRDGSLTLFYKAGRSPRRWWGLMSNSIDQGRSWSQPVRLPAPCLGPIKNKALELADGSLLCPSSTETFGWRCHLERYERATGRWSWVATLNRPWPWIANQPALLDHGHGRLQALCRTRNRSIATAWSQDHGRTWSGLVATELPNPNSGIDAVTLRDGRHLLVFNPTRRGRTPLALAVSDDGRTWRTWAVLEDEPGEYSYPAIIQAVDGTIHLSWTWRRQKIAWVSLQPSDLPAA